MRRENAGIRDCVNLGYGRKVEGEGCKRGGCKCEEETANEGESEKRVEMRERADFSGELASVRLCCNSIVPRCFIVVDSLLSSRPATVIITLLL